MLITPKLQMPPLRAKMLPREHLHQRMTEGIGGRLLFINGPAGSGKTSLACQWLSRQSVSTAWYSLDEGDNDIDVFLRFFLGALARTDRRLAAEVEPWIQGHKSLTVDGVLPGLIDLLSRAHRDVYIVLDDYHCINESQIHDVLQQLFSLTLPTLHMIILSRYALPFSIARMKVRNQVVEITAQEMKISYEETAAFFRDIMSLSLADVQLRRLAGQMEGWLGGLQLFGLSLQGKQSLAAMDDVLNRAYRDAVEYLIDEVLDTQPEEVKAFLYTTALLERFNIDLCRLLTGNVEAHSVLNRVYSDNLFLICLDEEGQWFRYHHLFAQAVRKRVLERNSTIIRDICRKAALWFAGQGFVEDAFRQVFSTDDPTFAADLVEDIFTAVPEHVELAHCHRWLARLPEELLLQRPLIRLHDCRIKLQLAELSNVTESLADIEAHWDMVLERYDGAKRKLCEDYLFLLKQILPYWNDPENVDIPMLEKALQQIPSSSNSLSAFQTVLPFSHYYKGDLVAAGRSLKQIQKVVFDSENRLSIMIWFRVAATVERLQGRLHRAEAIVYQALRLWGDGDDQYIPLRFMVDLSMAWICFQRNELEKTRAYAEAVAKFVEQTRFVYEIADVNYLLSMVYAALGDSRNADLCMQRMQWASGVITTPGMITLADARAARLALLQGNIAGAVHWMHDRNLSLDETFSFRWAFECLVAAEVLITQGHFKTASKLIDSARKRCEAHYMMETILEIDVLRSIVQYQLNEPDQAKDTMQKALLFAQPQGYLRPFVDHVQWICPMLAMVSYEETGVTGNSFHSQVSDACGFDPQPEPIEVQARQQLPAKLTRREIDILALMAKGYKNKEIAEKSYISLHTVKTHVKNIFEKLNVTSRVQAVRQGHELKLI